MSVARAPRHFWARVPFIPLQWTGAWSDGSSDWTPRMKKALNYQPKDGDGVFWMVTATALSATCFGVVAELCRFLPPQEFSDFCQNYANLYMCFIYPPEQVGVCASKTPPCGLWAANHDLSPGLCAALCGRCFA